MKRILLPLIALLLSVGVANAQHRVLPLVKSGSVEFAQNPAAKADPAKKNIAKAPARITLASNQKILGGYDTDEIAKYGLGFPRYPGTIGIASYLDSNLGRFDGGKLVSIRYGLVEAATVTSVFLYTVDSEGRFSKAFEQSVTGTSVAGWNTVTLDQPYTINIDGVSALVLGYNYVQTNTNDGTYYLEECYPSSYLEDAGNTLTLAYGNLGQGTAWYQVATYGSLSVQAIVEKDYPDDIAVSNMSVKNTFNKTGATLSYGLSLQSCGSSVPASYKLNVDVDGKTLKTLDTPTALSATKATQVIDNIALDSYDLGIGRHLLKVYVAEINGNAPAASCTFDDTMAVRFTVYDPDNVLPRQKCLVEHFTSTSCTACPLGDVMLKSIASKRNDIARVSVHGIMNPNIPDPFYFSDCNVMMNYEYLMYFPSASFNRTMFDLGTGSGYSLLQVLGYNSNYIDMVAGMFSDAIDNINTQYPSFANINVSAIHDAGAGKLVVKVSGEGVEQFAKVMGDDATLTVYLIEDGLVAPQQLNQDTWENGFTHESVLRQCVSSVYGDAINWNGKTYENDYTIDWNTEWNASNMRVVAFIGRPIATYELDDMYVTNTEMADVKEYVDPAGISQTVSGNGSATEVARYTADGVRLKAPAKGLNIVKLSDGRTIKVMVR